MKENRFAMAGICLFILAAMIGTALGDTETDNRKNQDKNQNYESEENAETDEVTVGIWEAGEDVVLKKETTESDVFRERKEETEISETQVEEILFEEPEDIEEYQWVYDYWSDFDKAWDGDNEWNLPYVDNETFEMLLAAYEEVDFGGEFEPGEKELYDEYREKYWQMLQNNGPVMDKETGRVMSLTEYLDSYTSYCFDHYDWNEFGYYFYDVDGDGAPELGIYSFNYFVYLFDYEEETDQFSAWYKLESYYYQQAGTRKVMWTTDKNFAFYFLDEDGNVACETFYFYRARSGRDSTRYLNIVMLPLYAEKRVAATEKMKENGIYVRSDGDWYFRLTDEQEEKFADVYLAFNEAYKSAESKSDEVFYYYEELFGDLMDAK